MNGILRLNKALGRANGIQKRSLYLSEIWLCNSHIKKTKRSTKNWQRSKEVKIISYQVIRVQKFTKNSLGKIGAETERTSRNNRNADIDTERTPLNLYFKKSTNGMNAEWKSIVEKTNATFKDTKKSVAFEGIIVTSDKAFFEKLELLRKRIFSDKPLEILKIY